MASKLAIIRNHKKKKKNEYSVLFSKGLIHYSYLYDIIKRNQFTSFSLCS